MGHLTPAQALKATNAKLHAGAVGEVQPEQDGPVEAEPPPKCALAWLRLRLAQEPDFKNEENMVAQEILQARPHIHIPPKVPLGLT